MFSALLLSNITWEKENSNAVLEIFKKGGATHNNVHIANTTTELYT